MNSITTSLPLQLFGTIEDIEGITLEAMLCIDRDCSNEAMLHWWGENVLGGALVKLLQKDSVIDIEPIKLYRTNERLGLFPPNLNQSELDYFKGFLGRIKRVNNSYEGEWNHVTGIKGQIHFTLNQTTEGIKPVICANWNEFKSWASRARDTDDVAVFRGHGSNSFPLKTSLHRVGRHRLERYCSETLWDFKGHAEALLEKRFNISDGEEYSILLGLAQHHGLPTPLLDWTCSPYIAAYFAFADALESLETRPNVTHVRIYGLTNYFVNNFTPPNVEIPYISPYLAYLDISKRNNPRLYAQQGRFLVTNVADIEHFLCDIQNKKNCSLLIAADVPIKYASEALADLQFMGLSAATMFPGLDGVCKMLKHSMSKSF